MTAPAAKEYLPDEANNKSFDNHHPRANHVLSVQFDIIR